MCRLTFHGFGLGLTALAHLSEKLFHLLQGEQVVQCLQWVNRWHHGATFESCNPERGREREKQPVVPLYAGNGSGLCACSLVYMLIIWKPNKANRVSFCWLTTKSFRQLKVQESVKCYSPHQMVQSTHRLRLHHTFKTVTLLHFPSLVSKTTRTKMEKSNQTEVQFKPQHTNSAGSHAESHFELVRRRFLFLLAEA